MDTEARLVEWGREKHYPGWDIPAPTGGVLGRLIDDSRDERMKAKRRRKSLLRAVTAKFKRDESGRRRSGFVMPCKETLGVRMEIVTVDGDSVACPPDGGMGAMVERMARSIELSKRCKEVDRAFEMMPEDMRTIVRLTYRDCASPLDVPREASGAARLMGVSERTYFRRKAEMIAWLAGQLFEARAAA